MKIRLAAITLGIVIAAAAVTWRVSRPAERQSHPAKAPVAATLEGINLRGRDWQLLADAASVSRDRDHVTLLKVRRASLTRNGENLLSITCARLDLDRRTGDMTFSENVRVNASSGLKVQTQSLRWQAGKQLMTGSAPATITLGEAAMKVAALSYSAREKRLECSRGIRLATADSYVSGARLVVLLDQRQVRMAGDIRARMAVDEAERFMSSGPGGAVQRLLSFPPL